ncbi:hypothetical protein [Staphylococcus epidermidis]|uniref:hypothetical protein n=1 Tax=Staphylococcus epidermidis TaxID=1282 RepID=UPI0016427946|nr:hypothetical protein [Staphylococcus epidermidis]
MSGCIGGGRGVLIGLHGGISGLGNRDDELDKGRNIGISGGSGGTGGRIGIMGASK